MTVKEFKDSPETSWNGALLALWYDGRGNWERAHEAAQEVDGADGAWVHAYLHRKQGDAFNASYWYRRAGKPVVKGDLSQEWARVVETLLQEARSTHPSE